MDKVTIYRVLWSTLKLDATNRHGLADVITLEDHRRALDAERERLKGQIDYSIQLQQLIESLRRDDTPSPELYHHKIIVEFKRQLATLQAQLRQVEGERDEWERKCRDLCQAHGVLLIEHHDIKKELTTLRQLVAQLPVVDAQEVSVWLSPDESGWLVSKRPAFPAGLYWAKFRTQAEADSFRALLAYRAALAAKDARKAVSSG